MMDPLFRARTLGATPNPNQLMYLALHQDYSSHFVGDGPIPTEEECADIIIKRLLRVQHYGPLEHGQITINFGGLPHSVMQQARTHRGEVAGDISFDCQCLTYDTEVTFVDKRGRKKKTLKIGEIYKRWQSIPSYSDKAKKMRVRSLDEAKNVFTIGHIEDVIFSGINPVYEVTLADGKKLVATKNHKIYTPSGWKFLSDINVGDDVMVNGQPLKDADKTYQNKEWLLSHFCSGLIPREVAAIAGCSTEAVKKWAYHHRLTWQKRQWNKGIKYSISISDEERERRRRHARELLGAIEKPRGKDHPSWKADVPEEKRVYYWLKYNRSRIIAEKGGLCSQCGSNQKIHVHHIVPVRSDFSLAYCEDNMELLCSSCHASHHKSQICAHPAKVISIQYVGNKPTYDLSMKSPHHNFVANGIVVHNSFRYTGDPIAELGRIVSQQIMGPEFDDHDRLEKLFYVRPVGEYRNRDGGTYVQTDQTRNLQRYELFRQVQFYAKNREAGMPYEMARGYIAFDYRQHFVMSANTRTIMHLLDMRHKKDAQLECQQWAELLFREFKAWNPILAQWYEDNRLGKGRLAP